MDKLFRIRRAKPSDLPGIIRLENSCFSTPWSEESLSADLTRNDRSIYLVATDGTGALVGYAAFWAVHDEGQITNIAIDPDWRRLGIATALLKEIDRIAKTRKIDKILLEVREGNTAARRLYSHSGYMQIGLRKEYYEKPVENAIILLKEIEQ